MKQQTLSNMTTQELVSYTETLENIPEDVARELVKRVSELCEELEEAERETKDREDDFDEVVNDIRVLLGKTYSQHNGERSWQSFPRA